MSRSHQLSVLFLVAILVTAVGARAQICHDGLWPDGEFCGHDCRLVTGEVDMNHDCIMDYLDLILFSAEIGMAGPNLSADLDGNNVVDIQDIAFLSSAFDPALPVAPCNPSPANPNDCGGTLALSLDPTMIVSRDDQVAVGLLTVYVIADGWSNAGAIEYGLNFSPNISPSSETSPLGWTKSVIISSGNPYQFIWDGRGLPATGTTVVIEHQVFVTSTAPGSIELVNRATNEMTRWSPQNLDARTEFQVRRNLGINGIDPVSTTACPVANISPTVTITDPSGTISVPFATSDYDLAGTAADADSPLDFVEVRVDGGAWQAATGTSSWSLNVGLVVGDNWVQVRSADTDGAYSQTRTVVITRDPAPVCQDSLWPDGEFCGHDSYVVTTGVDMNHDCVNDFLDNILFFSELSASGPNLSADLDGNGVVDLFDVGLYTGRYDPYGTVTPCNPSPAYPDDCDATLSLSLEPTQVVSRGRLAAPGAVTVYLIAHGWTDAGAIEYSLETSANVFVTGSSSPQGWSSVGTYSGAPSYCWDGRAVPASGYSVPVQIELVITDTNPAYVELVDIAPSLTRWAPSGLDARYEFEVRRHLGINGVDPVSTTACPAANISPTIAITDPPGPITVPHVTASYPVAGTAADADSPLGLVEVRVNGGTWQIATGTDSWAQSLPLVVGENWIQARVRDHAGAYSSTEVVTIERLDLPDLTISAWNAPPDTVLNHGCLDLDVDLTVLNDSSSGTVASRVGFYLSDDATIDVTDHFVGSAPVSALSGGMSEVVSTTLTIPDDGPLGAVHLGAMVDDLDAIAESDETNNTASINLELNSPAILAVDDVGNDQGRFVRVTAAASALDAPGPDPVLQYEVFRRIDSLPKAGTVFDVEVPQISANAKLAGWEYVGAVPAHAEAEYNMIVPTLADSSGGAIHWSVFFVRAATATPWTFYDSCVDSGYSVDNLAPAPPKSLFVAYGAGGNQLTWDANLEDDLRHYRVYRGADAGFVPGPENLVESTIAVAWLDPAADPWDHHYKITAVDFAGNESPVAGPEGVSGTRELPAVPTSFALHQSAPNPFNPITHIKFDLPAQAFVNLSVYATNGRLINTLVNEVMPQGFHGTKWDGKDRFGRQVAAGVYFYRIETTGFTETKRMVLVK